MHLSLKALGSAYSEEYGAWNSVHGGEVALTLVVACVVDKTSLKASILS